MNLGELDLAVTTLVKVVEGDHVGEGQGNLAEAEDVVVEETAASVVGRSHAVT